MSQGPDRQDNPEVLPQENAGPRSGVPQADGPRVPALPFYVVGLGASAGGLEALERVFDHLPSNTGCAFVVIQHLSADHKSLMAELLSRHTSMPVYRAEDGMRVEPNTVYLITPSFNLELEGKHLRLLHKDGSSGLSLPIDQFLRSLSVHQGPRCAAVILSGTGSDGTVGVRCVKEAGGLVVLQDHASSRFDGMPRSAAATGLADAVVPPEEVPVELLRLISEAEHYADSPALMTLRPDQTEYSEIVGLLRDLAGLDFTPYKPSTVVRRIERRMLTHRTETVRDYVELMRESMEEARVLSRDLLITVTKFFRDGAPFDALREQVFLPLIRNADTQDTIRIWSAGCATGEEAYSMAMLFMEVAEEVGKDLDVKVFATDVDADAVEHASQATYDRAAVAALSTERLERYFDAIGEKFVVKRSLRQRILFAHHNVLRDPPFTKIDLISCRNLLIYLKPEFQRRVLAAFHFALKPGAALLLGSSETVGDLAAHFRPLDSKNRLFQSIGRTRLTLEEAISGLRDRRHRGVTNSPRQSTISTAEKAAHWLIAEYAPCTLLIDEYFHLHHVFGDATSFLRVPSGSPNLNILHMTPKILSALLASAIPRALRHGNESVYLGVAIPEAKTEKEYKLRVRPILEARGGPRMVLIIFEPATRLQALTDSVEVVNVSDQARRQLAELQQELQHSKENLQAMVEELETSNEELQATNEELLAANEELQSSNEELQSVNEELHTVNAEYEQKIQELTELNDDMDNLLRSTEIGTLFLDADLAIRKYTPAVTDFIHMLERDIGRPLEHLRIEGAEFLVDDARTCLKEGVPIEREAHRIGDRHVLIRTLPYITQHGSRPEGAIITFVDVTTLQRALQQTQSLIDSLPEHIAMLNHKGTIIMVNEAWKRFAKDNDPDPNTSTGVESNYLDVCASDKADDDSRRARDGIVRVLRGQQSTFTLEYPCHSPDQERWFLMHVAPLNEGHGAVVSHIDITRRKQAEQKLATRVSE